MAENDMLMTENDMLMTSCDNQNMENMLRCPKDDLSDQRRSVLHDRSMDASRGRVQQL